VDNPRVFASANLHGGLYAAPDPSGFRQLLVALPRQFRRRTGAHRDAGYDGVALVAALARTQGGQRFAPRF